MAKNENEIFGKMTSHADYEDIVSVFCTMLAAKLREYLLTDEQQLKFIDLLFQYQGFEEGK